MLSPEQIDAYCLQKPGAHPDFPFGPRPACYKVMGKIFAELYSDPADYKITLTCSPEDTALFRSLYEGVVVRGYYCPPAQQACWNTVYIARIDDGVYAVLDYAAAVRRRETPGGTGPKSVARQLENLRGWLAALEG